MNIQQPTSSVQQPAATQQQAPAPQQPQTQQTQQVQDPNAKPQVPVPNLDVLTTPENVALFNSIFRDPERINKTKEYIRTGVNKDAELRKEKERIAKEVTDYFLKNKVGLEKNFLSDYEKSVFQEFAREIEESSGENPKPLSDETIKSLIISTAASRNFLTPASTGTNLTSAENQLQNIKKMKLESQGGGTVPVDPRNPYGDDLFETYQKAAEMKLQTIATTASLPVNQSTQNTQKESVPISKIDERNLRMDDVWNSVISGRYN